jgi:hypothetical protein
MQTKSRFALALLPGCGCSSPSGIPRSIDARRRPVNGQGCAGGGTRPYQATPSPRHGRTSLPPVLPCMRYRDWPHAHSRHGCVRAIPRSFRPLVRVASERMETDDDLHARKAKAKQQSSPSHGRGQSQHTPRTVPLQTALIVFATGFTPPMAF